MDQSPLDRLPAEMRNLIYHFALVKDDPIPLLVHKGDSMHRIWRMCRQKNFLALSSTCKQVRTECLPVFFKGNRFEVESKEDCDEGDCLDQVEGLCAWKDNLGTWAYCLRSLDISFFVSAADVGLSADFWSISLNILRDTFDLPKLSLLLLLRGVSSQFGASGYELTVDILNDETDLALEWFKKDLEELKARIAHEVTDDRYIRITHSEFDDMASGVEHILKKYKEKT